MKITQLPQKKRKYIIEMTKPELDDFFDSLTKTQRKIFIRALERAFAEALRGMGKIKEVKKKLAALKKFGLKIEKSERKK